MESSSQSGPGMAQASVLFRDVRMFDGTSEGLRGPGHVLVVGKRIDKISEQPIEPPQGARVIEGGGRVLMPGLIDAHWHAMRHAVPSTGK